VSRDRHDAVVIGAGHNGLVAGAYLARAGLRVQILERREKAGGAVATDQLAPGISVPAVAQTVGRLRRSVARDLRLGEHGLRLIRPEVRAFAPQPDGRAVTLWADPSTTADGLKDWSAADAFAYARFDRKVRALASFLAYLHAATPPDLKSPSVADAVAGLRLGRAYRRLGHTAGRELLRVLPMAVADVVMEAFESEGVRGVLAARGIQYTAMGPWSSGTAAVMLADSAGNDGGAAGQTAFAAGGPGALGDALVRAARSFGAEVRCGAQVASITSANGRASGVALSGGEEIPARTVVSGADPKRTLLDLCDPVAIGPTLGWRAGNIRTPGTVAKVNLALAELPLFPAAGGRDEELLRGRIVIAPGIDYVEQAFDASKYGRTSDAPYLEATIPSLADPSLAPAGTHVMSVLVQYAPYQRRDGDWDADREGLGDLAVKTMEEYAPGLSGLITDRQVLTPLDLEREYGLTGGHPLHGEPSLDQFFAWRPLLGHARYRLAMEGLYLCGSGAHPGGGVTGAPGANAAREIIGDLKRGGR
jgi:phytoene dehydrogenase-like protein